MDTNATLTAERFMYQALFFDLTPPKLVVLELC